MCVCVCLYSNSYLPNYHLYCRSAIASHYLNNILIKGDCSSFYHSKILYFDSLKIETGTQNRQSINIKQKVMYSFSTAGGSIVC